MPDKTLFQRIADREIPADIVHEDDRCLAFRDVAPQAPTHVLIVPRRPIAGIQSVEPGDAELLGHLLITARAVADQLGLDKGYRLVLNVGEDGGQSVPHLHVHLLGGRSLTWPPG